MSPSKAIVVLALILLLPVTFAFACVTCGFDYIKCVGRVTSSICDFCECSATKRVAYSDVMHPGFFSVQKSGKLFVSGVIPSSPAAQAGILPGDQVLSINKHSPILGSTCADDSWASPNNPYSSELVIRRANHAFSSRVNLRTIREIVQAGWASSKSVHSASLHDTSLDVALRSEGMVRVFHSLASRRVQPTKNTVLANLK